MNKQKNLKNFPENKTKYVFEWFNECDTIALLKSFKIYWRNLYRDSSGRITRSYSRDLEAGLKEALIDIQRLSKLPYVPSKEENVPTKIVGEWVIEEDSPIDNFLHLWGEELENPSGVTWSVMGTDWPSQIRWSLNLDDINLKGQNLTKEDILARLLFELTFFGFTWEACQKRNKKFEKE